MKFTEMEAICRLQRHWEKEASSEYDSTTDASNISHYTMV